MLRGLRMACLNDVDFASFAERLAEVSSEVILPFFRSEIGADDKSDGGDFRSGYRGRPRRRSRHASPDQGDFPRSRDHRRGIWRGEIGSRPCLGARPDRRNQEFHFWFADMGDAGRTDEIRSAGLWDDVATIHPRAIFRRQPMFTTALGHTVARRFRQWGMEQSRAAL